ncbi:MAG: bifunctional nuclease family protein [Armatimonadota bacterium]
MAVIPVEVWQMVRDESEHDVIILREEQGGRVLPISIGMCEAAAIWVCLAPDVAAPYLRRPWSHDLMQSILERRKAVLDRVVIDGFSNSTFYATLHLTYQDQEVMVDARPSDAIALLLRMHAPLFVDAEVMDQASFLLGEIKEDEEEDNGGGLDFGDDLPS